MYVVVAGAGHMGTLLVSRLVAAGHETAVIDVDRAVTERLYAEQGIVVFTGSATDVNVLDQAGIKRADVAVAMTGRDADNLAFCLLARYYGVPRVLARMLNPQYQVPYRLVGSSRPSSIPRSAPSCPSARATSSSSTWALPPTPRSRAAPSRTWSSARTFPAAVCSSPTSFRATRSR
jgi:Trk K+ transport system NAD-binding subunit